MPVSQGLVNPPGQNSATDGNNYPVLQGKQLEQIVAELHGKYYTQTYRQNVFWGSSASAGAAIPAAGTTSPTGFVLWNKSGNGKLAVPIRMMIGYVATTETAGNIQLSFLTGTGSAVGTAAPLTAFTAATPVNGYIGGNATPVISFGTAATLTTAGTLLGTLGFMHLVTTAATTTFGGWVQIYEFDGSLIVPPGVVIYPTASAATAATYTQTIVWEEVPI